MPLAAPQQIFAPQQMIGPMAAPQLAPQPSFWGGTPNPNGGTDYLGGFVNYNPKPGQTGSQRLGLFGSTLKDIGAFVSGHPGDANNLAGTERYQDAQSQMAAQKAALAQVQQQLSDANAKPEQVRQALVNYALMGGDLGGVSSAMSYGRPTIKAYGIDQNVVSTDPITGENTVIQQGQRKPITVGGMQSVDNGKTFTAIPGYVAQQSAIYNARDAASAAHRAPKAAAPGAIAVPHPGSLY